MSVQCRALLRFPGFNMAYTLLISSETGVVHAVHDDCRHLG